MTCTSNKRKNWSEEFSKDNTPLRITKVLQISLHWVTVTSTISWFSSLDCDSWAGMIWKCAWVYHRVMTCGEMKWGVMRRNETRYDVMRWDKVRSIMVCGVVRCGVRRRAEMRCGVGRRAEMRCGVVRWYEMWCEYLGWTSMDPSLKSSPARSFVYPLEHSSLIALVALATPSAVPVTVMTMWVDASLSPLGVWISTPVASVWHRHYTTLNNS